jgi:hypothetical protein
VFLSKNLLLKPVELFFVSKYIILSQTLLGWAGIVILFATLKRLGIPPLMNYIFIVLTGLNIYQFIWDRALLTESLYIFVFTTLMWMFLDLLIKPTIRMGILFILVAGCGFLIKPAGILFPYILLPIVWLMHRSKKVFVAMCLLLAIYTTIPVVYAEMNNRLYQYHGISMNSDIALFGRILHHNFPIETVRNVTPNLYQNIIKYRQLHASVPQPWNFFEYYNNDVLVHAEELKTFNTHVIVNQIVPFTKSVISDIPLSLIDVVVGDVLFLRPIKLTFADWLFYSLVPIIQCLQKSTVLFLILFPCTIVLFIKKQSIMNAFLLSIAFIEIYQIFSSAIYGGSWEFARHLITTQTYLFFFCFWWICYGTPRIIQRIQHAIKKLSDYVQ